tara:strand:- start:42234 stop:44243 length:2010 start_codon:yes stop_codon:yes gene_type:complete
MLKITLKQKMMLCMLLVNLFCFAQTNVWTGQQSTYWNTPANWSLNQIPTLDTNVLISVTQTGNYPVVTGEDGVADCNNITIEEGASVTVSGDGAGQLRIEGAITNNGVLDATDGTIVMIGIAPQLIPASAFSDNTVRNLTSFNITGVTLSGPLSLTGILRVRTGNFNTGGYLTLKSNATTTAIVDEVDGSITGDVTVERYIPARRAFRFLSSPTTGGTILSNWQENKADIEGYGTDITGPGGEANGFDISGSNNPSMFTHNNESGVWEAVTETTTTLQAGTPYRLMVRGDRTVDQTDNNATPTTTVLRSTGTLETGDVQLYFNSFTINAGYYLFLGNPYQAPVDMQAVLADATNIIEDYYFVWDPTLNSRGSYVTVNVESNMSNIAASEANRYLQPNQAFFVQIESTGLTELSFNEEHKYVVSNTTNDVYRTNNEPVASLKLTMFTQEAYNSNEKAADGFTVLFADGYNNSLDGRDAVKPGNLDEGVGTINSSKVLSFEKRQMPVPEDVIPVSNTNYRTTDYVYVIDIEGIENVNAFLHDKYTGTMQAITNNETTAYSFSINSNDETSSAANRFDIVFAEALSSGDFESMKVAVYPNPVSLGGSFTVQAPDAVNLDVNLYDTLGRQVGCTVNEVANGVTVMPQSTLSAGVYMVQVSNGGKTITKKIIIK